MLNTDVYMIVSARPIERKSKEIIDVLFFFTVILTIFTGYKIHGNSLVGISLALIIVSLLVQNIRLSYREITVTYLFAGYVITVLFLSAEIYHIFQNLRYWFGVIFYIFGSGGTGAQHNGFCMVLRRKAAEYSYMEPEVDESTPLGGRRTNL